MDKFKFFVFTVVVFGVLGLAAYWSFATIPSGSEFVSSQKIEKLQNENDSLKKELKTLTDELAILKPKIEEPIINTEVVAPTVEQKPTDVTVSKNQVLINELQKLIDDKIFMKLGSKGTRVGTLQKFLNIYNNTSNKVDNDYGKGMQTVMTAFQKAEGLTADGEAGPSTYSKMIDWLKKQN